MNVNLKISIIVPVYKVEKYLCQCIDSIIKQTYSNLEILLIDDGSPDRCPKICDEYGCKDERVKVIHKKNGGLASARNAGLNIATGDLISFIDSDDWIDESMYQQMLEMKFEKNADIVCCEGIHTDGKNLFDRCFCCKPTGTCITGEEATKEILLDQVGSQAVKGLYDKKCWDGIRFPVGMLYEDIPTTFKAFEKANIVAYVDEAFYKYRINPKSISGSPNALKAYHQFLGFKSHYDHALLFYPEIADQCCSMTAHYAISTYLHSCTDASEELKQYTEEIVYFLKEHKKDIYYKYMPKSRAYALKIFYISDQLFRVIVHVFYKTGLQKRMGFDIK